MKDEAVEVLAKAAGVSIPAARRIMERLEANGMTVYKKKVSKNERRPASSQTMTEELAQEITLYYAENPEATQQQIANEFNVNIGRVNEVLNKADDNADR